jgi:hypothetical protein
MADDEQFVRVADLLAAHSSDLQQLRSALETKAPGLLQPHHDDIWLLRFLDHNTVEKATERVHDMLMWRRENEMDTIAAKVIKLGDFTLFPHYATVNKFLPLDLYYGTTKHGNPFAVERWGISDLPGLLNHLRPDEYLEFSLYKFEFMRLKLDEVVKETGIFHRWSAVMDVAGATMKHAHRPFVDMLKKVAKTIELHYRELMGKVVAALFSNFIFIYFILFFILAQSLHF